MYCAKCGGLVNNTLNFCNSCGAKLTRGKDSGGKPAAPLSLLICAVGALDIAALFVFALLTLIFLERHVDERTMAAILTLYLFFLAAVNFKLIRLITKLVGVYLDNNGSTNETQPANLPSKHTTAQLDSPRQPVTSVTENTTRTLNEVLLKER
jgi:hypothetical protein